MDSQHLYYTDSFELHQSNGASTLGLGITFSAEKSTLAKAGYAQPFTYRQTKPADGILRAENKHEVSHIIANAEHPDDFSRGIKNLAADLSNTRAEFALRISSYTKSADIFLIDNPDIPAPKPELMDYTETVRTLLSYDMVSNTQEDYVDDVQPPEAKTSLRASLSVPNLPSNGFVQKLYSGFSRIIQEKPSDLGLDANKLKTVRVVRRAIQDVQGLNFDAENIVKELMQLNDKEGVTFELRLNTEKQKISVRYLVEKDAAPNQPDPIKELFDDISKMASSKLEKTSGHLR